ncbi:Uma2 family endonuclease [Alienimonas californiensis]|uniref:Putative restriction endonuclease domain-containing protein n=1 Tax=Alienimonas californiensis TaxID=2527989 RepID=A0A517PDU7_9PLAN|nr:Uma2 family endonuclease [Alienimonas californiensis]QDT17537.1 hypothetical protein CA12_36640 [Alienimonas californiensis]
MSADPSDIPMYTREEYLEFERDALTKHEFYRGRIRAMSGANAPHVLISGNVLRHLGNTLRRAGGGGCYVFNSDMRIHCPDGRDTYPDLSVCCGEPDYFRYRGTDTLRNPEAIVEVLSKSTADEDRGPKFASYRQIPSLREYLLLAYTHRAAERYVRTETGWIYASFRPLDGDDRFPLLSTEIAFDDAYALTGLPDEPPGPFRLVRAEDEPRHEPPAEIGDEEASCDL